MAVSAFFSRLKSGLSRSAARITGGITATFTKRKLDDAALEELEEQLIAADLGRRGRRTGVHQATSAPRASARK